MFSTKGKGRRVGGTAMPAEREGRCERSSEQTAQQPKERGDPVGLGERAKEREVRG